MTALDSSALVAIALREPGFDRLTGPMLDEPCAVGAPTMLECYLVLRNRDLGEGDAASFSRWLLDLPNVSLVAFDEALLSWAQLAFDRYGKGRGSGAGLRA